MLNTSTPETFSEQLRKAPPVKQAYTKDRRLHLTREEVERLAEAAKQLGRHAQRDALMIMTAYRHGMRAIELVGLKTAAINIKEASIAITRAKQGINTNHPFVSKQEHKDWQAWLKQAQGEYLFVGERGPLDERAFHKIVQRAGKTAGFEFPVHPHMLRHAAGYELTNNNVNPRIIQQFLGHKEIRHTVRYTALAPNALNQVKDIL